MNGPRDSYRSVEIPDRAFLLSILWVPLYGREQLPALRRTVELCLNRGQGE